MIKTEKENPAYVCVCLGLEKRDETFFFLLPPLQCVSQLLKTRSFTHTHTPGRLDERREAHKSEGNTFQCVEFLAFEKRNSQLFSGTGPDLKISIVIMLVTKSEH